MRDVGVVVPAAGMGRRMGGVRKAMLELAGEPMLQRTLRPLLAHPEIGWVAVALAVEELEAPPEWLRVLTRANAVAGPDARAVPALAGKELPGYGAPESLARPATAELLLVAGGAERGDSVRAGLEAIPEDAAVLLVHDAARPLVTRDVIDRTIAAARAGDCVVSAVPIVDTVKRVDTGGRVTETLDRNLLWRVQTPQAFPAAVLRAAYARAAMEGIHATDDATLVERFGGTVRVVEGAPENLKVTTPFDRVVAELLLREES